MSEDDKGYLHGFAKEVIEKLTKTTTMMEMLEKRINNGFDEIKENFHQQSQEIKDVKKDLITLEKDFQKVVDQKSKEFDKQIEELREKINVNNQFRLKVIVSVSTIGALITVLVNLSKIMSLVP